MRFRIHPIVLLSLLACEPLPSGPPVTSYTLIPESKVITAVWSGEVVGEGGGQYTHDILFGMWLTNSGDVPLALPQCRINGWLRPVYDVEVEDAELDWRIHDAHTCDGDDPDRIVGPGVTVMDSLKIIVIGEEPGDVSVAFDRRVRLLYETRTGPVRSPWFRFRYDAP